MTDKFGLWQWIARLFSKRPRAEMVKAMCNNCFQVIAIPAQGEWWCSDCEGKFHRIEP